MGKIENGNAHAPMDLKSWRDAMGYTVDDAVNMLGCPKNLYKVWEDGRLVTPRYILLAAAALALGIKL